jgi:hypothetical protein
MRTEWAVGEYAIFKGLSEAVLVRVIEPPKGQGAGLWVREVRRPHVYSGVGTVLPGELRPLNEGELAALLAEEIAR